MCQRTQQRHRSRLRPSRKFSWAKKGNNSKTYLRVIFCSWNRNYPPGCDLTCPHTRHRHRINNQSVDLWKPFFLSFQKTHRKGNIQSEFIFLEKVGYMEWNAVPLHIIVVDWWTTPPPLQSRLRYRTVQFTEILKSAMAMEFFLRFWANFTSCSSLVNIETFRTFFYTKHHFLMFYGQKKVV